MLINLSNHPSLTWEKKQTEAAREYGECIDLPFPAVDPLGSECYIYELANQYKERILEMLAGTEDPANAVHIMGEHSFTYCLASMLMELNITCLTSTSERICTEISTGKKEVTFSFVQFRNYIHKV